MDKRRRPRDRCLLCSLRIRRPPSARCAAASNPFRAALSGWCGISSRTSMWTSPGPPASSSAPGRVRFPDLSMRSYSAAASRTPPELRGHFCSLSAPPSQLQGRINLRNTTSFLRLFQVHLFLLFYPQFQKIFPPVVQSNF